MKTTNLFALLTMVLFAQACSTKPTATADIEFATYYPFNPPQYVCYRTPGVITVDGRLSPGEWDAIPWTDAFTDIEGDKRPAPYYLTRAKMAHDDNGMYFAALLEEPHVWGNLTEHDAVIFHDNDFEIFVNPTGDTHLYFEYEVNALGTTWDLLLTKPYRDNGVPLNNWETAGMLSAVSVDGTLNNPSDTDRSWSVEVFIPWSSLFQMMRRTEGPAEGEQIRVNFSRVQWTTEVQNGKYVKTPMPGEESIREHNWVWAPTGVINIHLPEYWGFVQFTETVAGSQDVSFTLNPDEEIKWMLRHLYYRQQEYREQFGEFAGDVRLLKAEEICPESLIPLLKVYTTPTRYEILLSLDGTHWRITEEGLVSSHRADKK